MVLFALTVKVSKSHNKFIRPKLLPKTNRRICFSILMVRIHLKLAIKTSSFKYFRTIRIEKQIRWFIFGRSFGSIICFWNLLTFSVTSLEQLRVQGWMSLASQIREQMLVLDLYAFTLKFHFLGTRHLFSYLCLASAPTWYI